MLNSCKSAKRSTESTTRKTPDIESSEGLSKNAASIINYAKRYEGVKYKYGGTTKNGMDCSGLIYTTFKAHDIEMPRTTKELSSTGHWVDIKNIKPGDLVFFATKKNSRNVNHVGIVTDTSKKDIAFIHASTSKGVIISKLSERYWYFAYVQARRYVF